MFFTPIILPLLVGIFLAINMGGSGTAPSFSAAYGANVIKRFAIPGLFGVFVILGALLAGDKVVLTLGKGIIPAAKIGMTVAAVVLLSVSISLLIANLLGVPQSTSQSTVFALAGPGLYYGNLDLKLIFTEIIPFWFILPIISFILTFLIIKVVNRFWPQPPLSYGRLEKYSFSRLLLIASACYVAFSIGSNNVANATGPLLSMVSNEMKIDPTDTNRMQMITILATLMIAPFFGIGSSIFGYRVVKAAGKGITNLTPMEANTVSIITASLLLLASLTKGIPTSLVQLNSLAIMAISVHKEGGKITFGNNTIRRFWVIWAIAPIIAFALSFFLIWCAEQAGLTNY